MPTRAVQCSEFLVLWVKLHLFPDGGESLWVPSMEVWGVLRQEHHFFLQSPQQIEFMSITMVNQT